ncbi:MAG: ATP-binding protein, partial [Acidobacteriota bacterium]|nr:ATP-binding protein [Acidobacteriota bacterium]
MTGAAAWHEANSAYLSSALAWLRLRLERLGSQEPAGRSNRGSDDRIARAAAELAAIKTRMDPPPALVMLERRLDLSSFECDVLLLCAAMEFDTRTAALCARAQDDPSRCYPTFALALSLFEDAAWDVVSPERPLRYWRLIEPVHSGSQALTSSPLRADERIVNYLKGLNLLDDRLVPLLAPLDVSEAAEVPHSQQPAVEQIVRHWTVEAGSPLPVVQLLGPEGPSKHLVAQAAAKEFGCRVYRLGPESLPSQSVELESLIRLWRRESLLLPVALYLDAQELDTPAESAQIPLRRLLARSDGFFFLATREVWLRAGRSAISIDVAKPTAAEQRTAWATALGGAADGQPALLAGQFHLNLPAIHEIARTALGESGGDRAVVSGRLWDACRASVRPRLDLLAQRLDVKATWGDIVLRAEDTDLLHQVAAQVAARGKVYGEWGFGRKMNRGMGITALFSGDSGTGKTMAAEVIANDLRLNLYRIDLSAVVSKYIGETEKNLCRLFDAAEDGGAILFFDEADALFGKRSEIKDSHDRYANIEVNYLLQRMESYRGLAILATNMKSALDNAFLRRLRFVVNFA